MSNEKNLSGILAMLGATALFSLMDAGMKLLSPHYPAMQVAAVRALSSLPLVCVYVLWRGSARSLIAVRWPLHLLRGALGIGMLSLFAFGLRQLPLAEAYSIFFIAPLLITALSVPLLQEKVGVARWTAIAIGLIGMLVVLRPTGAGMLSISGLAILASAVFYAISAITVRVLGRSDSGESMVFWLMVMVSVGAGTMAAPEWIAIRDQDWRVVAGVAVTGFLGQIAITEAFRHGQASAIAPFEYTARVWAIGLDWALWRTMPDVFTLLGGSILIASGVYLARRERVHSEAEHP